MLTTAIMAASIQHVLVQEALFQLLHVCFISFHPPHHHMTQVIIISIRFPDNKPEAQTGLVTHSRSHSQ